MPPTRRTRQQPISHGRIVATALGLLSRVGLPDLTMRAIGTELVVQQSALYHHFANKQAVLGAVADEIIARAPRPPTAGDAPWQERVQERCAQLHAAVTAYPDGADLVMVYHRLPYEEAVEDGKPVRRRHRSPNGILPSLLSFFKGEHAGTWVAW